MPRQAAVTRAGLGRVHLGPVSVDGHKVILRNTRLSDFERWREIRLQDREFIEPFWTTSALSWDERHTRAWWIREYLRQRHARAMFRALPLSVIVDGEFSGQCNLTPIDAHHRSAELGIWVDSRHAGHGVGAVAGALIGDYAFDRLGLHRITAPVCVGNRAARHQVKLAGMSHEATMIRAISVNGERRDHELWAVTADQRPPAGYLQALIAAGVGARVLPEAHAPMSTRLAEHWHDAVAASPVAVVAVIAWYYLGTPLRGHSGHAARTLPARIEAHDREHGRVTLRNRTSRLRFRLTGRVVYEALAAGEPIGRIGLDCRRPNLGLAVDLDTDPARRAAATAALRLLVDHALGDLGIERLEAVVDPAPDRLAPLLAGAGMHPEGVLTGARIDCAGAFHDLAVWGATGADRRARPLPDG
ncbi:GNAT family N-acetyltransferase [Nocardia sp. 2]|uniref:GNAT family N-acetyltransferase n=1 Tax=Nocardia acididurans TaxID=2802282 RepID=A0ABS1M0M4_9NOCA|nr:GNAT family protein [Nocardia acididurans]MBL1074075.1 GNAT family N-acetyltransferase [Nocardia acididurans]